VWNQLPLTIHTQLRRRLHARHVTTRNNSSGNNKRGEANKPGVKTKVLAKLTAHFPFIKELNNLHQTNLIQLS
jgi:hypothetical protein